MALSSSSTFAQIEAEYLDTASYFADDDLGLAKRHSIAIRYMLLKIPTNTVKGGNSVSYSMSLLKAEKDLTENFIHQKELAGKRFIRASGQRFRGRG